MTVLQIIIGVCLYLYIGSIIGNAVCRYVEEDDTDWVIIIMVVWPIIMLAILFCWIMTLFRKLGELTVDCVKSLYELIDVIRSVKKSGKGEKHAGNYK